MTVASFELQQRRKGQSRIPHAGQPEVSTRGSSDFSEEKLHQTIHQEDLRNSESLGLVLGTGLQMTWWNRSSIACARRTRPLASG